MKSTDRWTRATSSISLEAYVRSAKGCWEPFARTNTSGHFRSFDHFTDLVRRQPGCSGVDPRRARVSSARPSSRHTRHYAIGPGLATHSSSSLTSRSRRRPRLQLAREILALSLPPNPEDAPLFFYRFFFFFFYLFLPHGRRATTTTMVVVDFFSTVSPSDHLAVIGHGTTWKNLRLDAEVLTLAWHEQRCGAVLVEYVIRAD